MYLLDVRPDHLKIVLDILQQHAPDYEVWAFGSRAKWTAKEYSDLDLCIISSMPLRFSVLGALADDFTDSNLPYKVDVVDWATTSESFRKIIQQDKVVIQKNSGALAMSYERPLLVFDKLIEIVSEKAKANDANLATYVSTENMEANFGGVKQAASLPSTGGVTKFKAGDTLFSNIRTYFKKVWMASYDGHCSNDVLVFRPRDSGVLHPSYLHNLCRWELFTEFSVRTSKGAKMPRGDKDALIQFQFPLPSIDEQGAIAQVLSSLDDRITLLRETNSTLEAIAQALFKSWFVDFDPVRAKSEGRLPDGMDEATAALFPDSFEETELGLMPRGWKATRVAEVAEVVKGKSYSSKDLVETHHTALVTLKSFERGGGFRMDGFKPYSGAYKAAQIVRAGDLILAYTDVTQAAELIGKPAIVVGVNEFQTLVASLDVGIIRPNEAVCGKQFLYGLFRTDAFQAHTLAHTSGTTVLHLAKDGVGSYVFLLPNFPLIHAFEEIASTVGERKQINSDAIRTLANLRNTLLPRLISGQLRVAEVISDSVV
jgi:type I restriction enzyme S subunit